MKKYTETLKKLFEAIDPEGQLADVQADMNDSLSAAIDAEVAAQVAAKDAEVAAKDEQVKALEGDIAELKRQIELGAQAVPGQIVLSPEQQVEIASNLDALDAQAQEYEQVIADQTKEIEDLKNKVAETEKKLQCYQSAVLQNMDACIQKAKDDQKAEDDEIAIKHTQKLLDAIDKKSKAETDNLVESVSTFIDSFINNKTNLQVAINANALAEAHTETFNKIRELLIEQKLFESGIKEEAAKIIESAKSTANEQINEAIEIGKRNNELTAELTEAQHEIDVLRGQIHLAEKVKFLRPSVAEALTESLKEKTVTQIDKEFDRLQKEIEKNEAERKQLLRKQSELRSKKINKDLEDTAVEIEKAKAPSAPEQKGLIDASLFAKLIKK